MNKIKEISAKLKALGYATDQINALFLDHWNECETEKQAIIKFEEDYELIKSVKI